MVSDETLLVISHDRGTVPFPNGQSLLDFLIKDGQGSMGI
jgi:hypothetical protein